MSTFTEDWVVGPQGTEFYERKYTPAGGVTSAKAAIIWLHGFPEHVARHSESFEHWAARDIAVLAFDQRGFGRTGAGRVQGKRAMKEGMTCMEWQREDLEFFVRRCAEWVGGKKVVTVGYSMGATVSMSYVCDCGANGKDTGLGGVILLSPMTQFVRPIPTIVRTVASWISYVFPWLSALAPVDPVLYASDPQVVKEAKEDPLIGKWGTFKGVRTLLDATDEMNQTGAKGYPVDLPFLWIHSTLDNIQSFEAAQSTFDRMSTTDKTFNTIEGGFHDLLHEPDGMKERVMEDIASWILARCDRPA